MTSEPRQRDDYSVRLRVAPLADFLVMKALAIGNRDKPKDANGFCYCLDQSAEGPAGLAAVWRQRTPGKLLCLAVGILREKFASVNSFGPQQVVEFHNSANPEEQAIQARRALELAQAFLRHFD